MATVNKTKVTWIRDGSALFVDGASAATSRRTTLNLGQRSNYLQRHQLQSSTRDYHHRQKQQQSNHYHHRRQRRQLHLHEDVLNKDDNNNRPHRLQQLRRHSRNYHNDHHNYQRYFSEENNDEHASIHMSLLRIEHATFEDTGLYTCSVIGLPYNDTVELFVVGEERIIS